MQHKDEVLNRIAPEANVAQFVSFSPDLSQRFAWIHGWTPNTDFHTPEGACAALLTSAESHMVNIRSFKSGAAKGNPLFANIKTVGEAVSALAQRANDGFFTIVNEVIPLDDGGVSGVTTGDVIEFAPGDTPKCVDKPDVASLPLGLGTQLLELVYGFGPEIAFGHDQRVEFSAHPIRRGYRKKHTIIWEVESAQPGRKVQVGKWPNRFSRLVGDKAYGLLIADLIGFAVPKTFVFSRSIAPFVFGKTTETKEFWLRTAPRVPVAGKYPTVYGWQDPYSLMRDWDPRGEILASILAQESVDFLWSGAARTTDHGVVVEGVKGRGDAFMVAAVAKQDVPAAIHSRVIEAHDALLSRFRSVKFEWVWDGNRIWIVQLHQRRRGASEDVIYPGVTDEQRVFNPSDYEPDDVLDGLRKLVAEIVGRNIGVVVAGDVGVTSHIGDILSEAKIPSWVRWSDGEDPMQMSFELESASSI